MKNKIVLSAKFMFCFISMLGLHFSNAQTQSMQLPIPSENAAVINFTDPANPVLVNLPVTPFRVGQNGPPGNPHNEDNLRDAYPSMAEYYLGQHPMFAQTVVHDADGNLLFFIVDNNIYNKHGEAMWDIDPNYNFPAYLLNKQVEDEANIFDNMFVMGSSNFNRFSSNGIMLDPEICVFPIPGNCYKFGLVFSFYKHGQIANASEVFYRTIEIIDENNVEMSDPIALTLHGISDDLADGSLKDKIYQGEPVNANDLTGITLADLSLLLGSLSVAFDTGYSLDATDSGANSATLEVDL